MIRECINIPSMYNAGHVLPALCSKQAVSPSHSWNRWSDDIALWGGSQQGLHAGDMTCGGEISSHQLASWGRWLQIEFGPREHRKLVYELDGKTGLIQGHVFNNSIFRSNNLIWSSGVKWLLGMIMVMMRKNRPLFEGRSVLIVSSFIVCKVSTCTFVAEQIVSVMSCDKGLKFFFIYQNGDLLVAEYWKPLWGFQLSLGPQLSILFERQLNGLCGHWVA